MKTMRFIITLLTSLFVLASCSEATKQTKSLYGHQWMPVHATGSYEDDYYSASWDGTLNKNGGIMVTFHNKNYPELTYEQEISYQALQFSKKNKGFCYLDITSLYEIKKSKWLQFKIEKGLIYFEETSETGRGTGNFGEGLPIKFLDDENVKIGDVTYQDYPAWYQNHKPSSTVELGDNPYELPIAIYL